MLPHQEGKPYEHNKHHDHPRKPFSIKDRMISFGNGYAGLLDMLKTEHNAWIHAAVTLFVLILCWWLNLDTIRFCLILVAITAVWMAEAFNTVVEMIVDLASPVYSRPAKRAKDVAAAAVLITSLGAAVLGLVVMGPPLIEKIKVFLTT